MKRKRKSLYIIILALLVLSLGAVIWYGYDSITTGRDRLAEASFDRQAILNSIFQSETGRLSQPENDQISQDQNLNPDNNDNTGGQNGNLSDPTDDNNSTPQDLDDQDPSSSDDPIRGAVQVDSQDIVTDQTVDEDPSNAKTKVSLTIIRE